jgi:hypothetical protein
MDSSTQEVQLVNDLVKETVTSAAQKMGKVKRLVRQKENMLAKRPGKNSL